MMRNPKSSGSSFSPAATSARLSFFFSSRRRHTRLTCDWSSDVCSSDLGSCLDRRQTQAAPLHPESTPPAYTRREIEPASGRRWSNRTGSAVEELPNARGDPGGIEAVLGVEPFRVARLAESLDAEPLERRRQHLTEHLSDGAAQAAGDRVVLHRHDVTRLARRVKQQLFVERLDARGVEHLGRDAVGLQALRRLEAIEHGAARADQRHVVAPAEQEPAAVLEAIVGRAHGLEILAREPEIERPLVLHRVRDDLLGLELVGGLDDPDVGERADAGDVLDPHLTVAVLADRDAGVGSDDLHVSVCVGDRDPDGLETPCDEARERAGERDPSGERQAGTDADHVRLGDAEVERAAGEGLRELRGHGGFRQIGVEGDDPVVLGAELQERFTERRAAGLGRHHFFSRAASSSTMARVAASVFKNPSQAPAETPSTSRMAAIASAGFGALPCHSGSFSMKDTPLPFTVWATTKVGVPRVASAWSRAFAIWATSWPLISTTGQPNDCHLAMTGSRSRIFFTKSSSWILL